MNMPNKHFGTKYHNRKKYIKLLIKNIKNGKIDIIPLNCHGTKNKELITYKMSPQFQK